MMSDKHSTYELLLRFLENDLSPDERTQVNELLRADAAARDLLRELAQQVVVIADVERVSHWEPAKTHNSQNTSLFKGRSASWPRVLFAVAAVVLVVLSVGHFLLRRDGQPEIVTINALNGPIEWIGDGGRVTEELDVGKNLPGGTMELLSADSWIEFEFRDKSTVTLSGQSAVTISEQQQKEVHLRHGSLSANVEPQPADCPMLVHTPSAELKVLGTQFNVDALPDATRLAVNEGLVRLKRLTDGKEVDVPARHEVTASMEDLNGLPLSERGKAVSVWKSDLRTDVVRGKWISDLWVLAMRLKKAVASGEMNEADAKAEYKDAATLDDERGSVWAEASPYGSLIVLSVAQSAETPVVLGANTKVRITGRLHSRVSVKFGMTTRNTDGRSTGKYSLSFTPDELAGNGNEFRAEVLLRAFQEETRSGDSPIGKELIDWWCVADATSAKVEITGVEVIE